MNKFLKYTLVSLPILVGGYFVYKQLRPKKKKEDVTPPPPPPPIDGTRGGGSGGSGRSDFKVRDEFPLKRGSRGEKVRQLQNNILASKNEDAKKLLGKAGADGVFGSGTEQAVELILKKKSVDNQAELDSLKKAISSAEADRLRAEGNKNRITFGQAIVDGFGKRQLFPIGGTKGITRKLYDASKQRVVEEKVLYFKQGQEAFPWGRRPRVIEKRVAGKGDPELDGFVYIWVIEGGNNVRYSFSPYDFALV